MNGQKEKQKNTFMELGMPIGTGFGVALGLVLMNVTGHNGMFPLGIALGSSIGAVTGLILDQREGKQSRK